jgi:HNH endonuclease
VSISADLRQQVRQRGNCACEFCGVREEDVGAALTIDHFQPRSKGGSDAFNNLVYACPSCNQYKQDYWPIDAQSLSLWNPRDDDFSEHFSEAENGQLIGLTTVGTFTIGHLRLNRSQLIAYRQNRRRQSAAQQLLVRHQDVIASLDCLNDQLAGIVHEQKQLLLQQQRLIRVLLQQRHRS